jgi:hypothetical protein
MTARWYRIFTGWVVLALAFGLGCLAASSKRASAVPPSSERSSAEAPLAPASGFQQGGAGKNACLECHGPFDELAKRTSGYQAPSGETVTPHRYVPHREPEEREIPECANCHQVHPVPPSAGDIAALRKPTVTWCYEKCHHTKDFTPCKACHPGYAPAPTSRSRAGTWDVGPGRLGQAGAGLP